MTGWSSFLADDPTDWLLEEDNPSARYLALRSLMELPEDNRDVVAARRAIMATGPVAAILAAQEDEGYWAKPGTGYSPKYQGTVWQLMFLAHLGADGSDERVAQGCEYLLMHGRAKNGAFSPYAIPITAIDCLNGNLIYAFYRLGWGEDERVQEAVHQLCASVAQRRFQCSANAKLPCAWGTAKTLLAFSALPAGARTGEVKAAIQEGVDFFLSRNLAVADYPCSGTVSGNWRKFGFPLNYVSNVLETLGALAELGYGAEPALDDAIRLVISKQDGQGRWKMEFSLNGKTWANVEAKGKPSKLVTLQAVQMLKRVFGGD